MAAADHPHDIRDHGGKYAKKPPAKTPADTAAGTPAAPGPSPHHGAVQSTYKGTQLTRTDGFKPHQAGQAPTGHGAVGDPITAAPSGL